MSAGTAHDVDCVVVGAGVVGLAVARALALVGRDVLVLEACNAIGTQISARNSEVIHAGMYYPTESLKANLCRQGRELLYAYCEARHIPHQRCGKLIVAHSDAQMDALAAIAKQAVCNGVADLQWLDTQQVQALEPDLQCVGALLSPSTGILDSHAFMLSLLGDLERAGGTLALNTAVSHMEKAQAAIEIIATDGTRLRAQTVINAAGLQAVALAGCIEGLDPAHVPRAYFAKGSYFALQCRSPFSRLVYPVPEPGGLGVHLTLDLAGQARFGPDVQWVESADDLQVDPQRALTFYAAIRRYWPGLPDGALVPAYAGMRPKISGPHEASSDFVIQGPTDHGVAGLVNLFGIESPGLTSALAIAEHVRALLAQP
jgi:L-2-hydroxyglutarate oxidase LhgO